MKTYQITYSVGTSRHDEARYVKSVKAANIGAVMAHVRAIETRPNTQVTAIKLTSEVFA